MMPFDLYSIAFSVLTSVSTDTKSVTIALTLREDWIRLENVDQSSSILTRKRGNLLMHCNLRPPEPSQSFMFEGLARPSLKSLNLSSATAFLQLIHYFTPWSWPLTLWPWRLTFDLENLQCIACDVMKLCTKDERSRAIRGGVIMISMTLNMWYVLRSALG